MRRRSWFAKNHLDRGNGPLRIPPPTNTTSLLRPRWNPDPCLGTRLNSRVVGPGAGTVVPVRLWRRRGRWLDVDRGLLNNDGRRRVDVVRRRRVVPVRIRWTPPTRPDADEDAGMPTPSVAWHRRNEKQRDRQKRNRC